MARPFEKVPSSTLNVTFSGLQLEKWADVWPLPFAGARAARFEPARGVRAASDAPPKIRVVGDLGLRQFDLRDKSGAELASWSALTVSRLELEPIARQAYIGDVGLWAPQCMRAATRTCG